MLREDEKAVINECLYSSNKPGLLATDLGKLIARTKKDRIEQLKADRWDAPPVTVPLAYCDRSAGGRHDFYSEGDYGRIRRQMSKRFF